MMIAKSTTDSKSVAVDGLSKRFNGTTALDDISFEVLQGEIHALCGHNGAGKSTLVRIISGVLEPDEGEVRIDGRGVALSSPRDGEANGIAVVDQELSLVPALSVEDNILLGSLSAPFFRGPRRAATAEVVKLLKLVGLERIRPSTYVSELAIGERQLVEIARGLGRGARTLILDEPTASLSQAEAEWVFAAARRAAKSGCGVVYVSHRLDEVLQLCHRVTVLRDGRRVTTSPVEEVDRGTLIHLMVGDQAERSRPWEDARASSQVALSVRDLSMDPAVRGFSLEVRMGEIIGLAGQVGAGMTTVLRALAGLEPRASGEVRIGRRELRLGSPNRARRAGIHFASNDRKGEGLFLGRTAAQNLLATRLKALSSAGVVRRGRARRVMHSLAGLIGLPEKRLGSPVQKLSGGNQQRVFLGRCLEQSKDSVLLLDEPTRGVDVGGRADIHRLIRLAALNGNAILFSSTELDELIDLADRVVTMYAGEVVRVLDRWELDPRELLADMTHAQRTVERREDAPLRS
jgi:ABC-type sugar transport system ATPase subunit